MGEAKVIKYQGYYMQNKPKEHEKMWIPMGSDYLAEKTVANVSGFRNNQMIKLNSNQYQTACTL